MLLQPHSSIPGSSARKARSILFYTATFVFFVGMKIYLLWALRSLLLPIIVGGLLAYICKPLLANTRVSWMPNSLRVISLLAFIGVGIVYLGKTIKSNIPNDNEQIVLQVRLNYKLHEKFNMLMGINEKTGKGNIVFNLVKDEITPVMGSIYSTLHLSKDEIEKFEAYYKASGGENNKSLSKYYKYHQTNLKRYDLDKKFTKKQASQKKSQAKRNVASTTKSSNEKSSILLSLLDVLSTWLLTPFVFIFLLFDNGQIMKFFVRLVPNKFFELSLTIVEEVDQAIGNYLRGTLIECGLVGLTLGTGLYFVGLDLNVAFIIGVVAGLANAIPFLGPVIGLVVGLSYGLIVEEINPVLPIISSENLFIGIFVCVLIAQLLDNTVFQPIVLGGAVNLHPLVVIIGVMGGSVIFGFAGMLLAIPAIVIFKVVFETLFKEMKAYRII